MKYEIIKYSPEFKSQVLELQTHLWGPDLALNAVYMEWKYERNPYMDIPLIYLALYKGQVVSMRGIYGAKWQISSPCQTFLIPCAGDTVTAHDHRKRGLFKKITMAAIKDLINMGYKYVFNLSAGKIVFLGSLSMGWCSVGPYQKMYLPNRYQVLRYYSRRFFRSSKEKQHPFYFIDKMGVHGRRVFLEKTPRPESMAELVKRTGSDGRIRHIKDKQYFTWRFQNPLSVYRFLFWEDASLEGYLVIQTSVNRNRISVNIVDWEAANTQVRTDLLRAAIHLSKFPELTIWLATLPDEAKALLQDTGFKLLDKERSIGPYRPSVLVRPVHQELLTTDWVLANRKLLDLTNWDLRMIYSDNY